MRRPPVRPQQGSSGAFELVVLLRALWDDESRPLDREVRRDPGAHRTDNWAGRKHRRRSIDGEDQLRRIIGVFCRSDMFITFPEGSGIEALEPGQAHLLPGVIERLVGLGGSAAE